MIRFVYSYFSALPAVFIDGLIYVALSLLTAWAGILTSDQARALVTPKALFWITSFLVSLNQGLLALKMFRSTAFADHQQDKKDALARSAQVVVLTPETNTTKQTKENDEPQKF